MKPSEKGKDFIKGWEQFRPTAYIVKGESVPTVGWGHQWQKGEKIENITLEEANKLFEIDIKSAVEAVKKNVTIALDQNKFDALVSLAYNMGAGSFAKCVKGLKALNAGDFEIAVKELFDDPNLASIRLENGKRIFLAGLSKRRRAEKALFNSI